MTSRERVLNAINRRPVDRIPIDLGSHMSTGISMCAYWNLREYLGLATDDIWIPDLVQGLAYVDTDVLERLHCDCILLEPRYKKEMTWNLRGKYRFRIPEAANPVLNAEGGWVVSKGTQSMRMPAEGYFFDGAWLNDWGEGTEDERIALYAKEAERIFKETDYATNFLGYSHGLGIHSYGGGSYQQAIRAFDEPEKLHAELEWRLQASLKRMRKVIDAFGPYVQMVSISDDLGTQSGPMCSPGYIAEFCMPYYKRFCEFVHANSDIKVFLHSCGSIRSLIPMLIDAGIDILNPVQISADDMDPEQLSREFGDSICFWGGGCNTQQILGAGTPEQVAANVRLLTGVFGRKPGFVFNQVHNIMGNVPPENIIAMFDTAYEQALNVKQSS